MLDFVEAMKLDRLVKHIYNSIKTLVNTGFYENCEDGFVKGVFSYFFAKRKLNFLEGMKLVGFVKWAETVLLEIVKLIDL